MSGAAPPATSIMPSRFRNLPPALAGYVAAFQSPNDEPEWLARDRREAIERFAEIGFPTSRDEAWRFTDLRPLAAQTLEPMRSAAGAGPVAGMAEGLSSGALAGVVADLVNRRRIAGTLTLALVDGRFCAELSDRDLPAAPTLPTHARRHDREQPDAGADSGPGALNAAFFTDGWVLRLDADRVLPQPLHILHIATAQARHCSLHTRSRVELAAGAQAQVIETFDGVSEGVHWSNATTEITLGAASRLTHLKLQAEPETAFHTAETRVALAGAAQYDALYLCAGGRVARQDVTVAITGERAACRLNGVYMLRGDQHATLATVIRHRAPSSATSEIVRGVVDDRAHGVFQGRITVDRAAQRTNANQLSQALLLSDAARVNAKPELEIHADDVKCTHGATVGDLNRDQLMYLRARGVPLNQARAMLIEGFLAAPVDVLGDGVLRAAAMQEITRWLHQGRTDA